MKSLDPHYRTAKNRRGLKMLLLLLAVFGLNQAKAADLLFDGFGDGVINPKLWQLSTPFSDSKITESGGVAVFQNRGKLLSVAMLPTAISITGQFTFTGNPHDNFKILLRTTGVITNPFGECDRGIAIGFEIQGDDGSTATTVDVHRNEFPSNSPVLASASFDFALNTPYDFRITDNGKKIAVYINNFATPILTVNDSTVIGNKIALYNREGAGGGSTISDGAITTLNYIRVLPLPSTFVASLEADLRNTYYGKRIHGANGPFRVQWITIDKNMRVRFYNRESNWKSGDIPTGLKYSFLPISAEMPEILR